MLYISDDPSFTLYGRLELKLIYCPRYTYVFKPFSVRYISTSRMASRLLFFISHWVNGHIHFSWSSSICTASSCVKVSYMYFSHGLGILRAIPMVIFFNYSRYMFAITADNIFQCMTNALDKLLRTKHVHVLRYVFVNFYKFFQYVVNMNYESLFHVYLL